MRLASPDNPDKLIIVPDCHPQYGLADSTRAQVLWAIVHDGLSVKEAAHRFNVGPATVYRWRAAVRKEL